MRKLFERIYMRLAKQGRKASMNLAMKAIVCNISANKKHRNKVIPLAFEGAPAESVRLENGRLNFKNQKHRFCWNDLMNIYRYINKLG